MEQLLAGASVRWEQPSARHSVHELRSESGLLATLELKGVVARATSASGSWRIERDITRMVRVWDVASGELVGELSKGAWTGSRTFTTSNGHLYLWEPANLWRTAWRFRSSRGVPLEFRAGGRILRASATIVIGHSDIPSHELELLTILARYIVLVADRDNAAAAGAAVVGSMPPV